MEDLINHLKEEYRRAGLRCGVYLLPPASAAAIDRAAGKLAQPIPESLRAVWRVHGGQRFIGGSTGLFGNHRLLTPAQAVKHYRLIWGCELKPQVPLTPPRLGERPVLELVPFASWDVYTLCVHAVSGEVWEFVPGSGLTRQWPGIEAVLREVLAAVRSGAEAELGW
jgi:hypothetical protein